jgi:hypothetical protein
MMPTPLRTYYSDSRGDNFNSATPEGAADANLAGYTVVRNEALVFAEGEQQPGMVPLKLFWSPNRGDNFTTATAMGEADATGAGYQFIRIEGYVFPDQQPGTIPLRQFWNPQREDNFLAATNQGIQEAADAQYQEIRTEGYALPADGVKLLAAPEANKDFGGGKHGRANATISGDGNLNVIVDVWTNSPFQGFTMGVKVLVLDANRTVLAETSGGPGPYGVDGTAVAGTFGTKSSRTEHFNQNFGAETGAKAAMVRIILFHQGRNRLIPILTTVVAVFVDIVEWVNTFCETYPDVCQEIRDWYGENMNT